MADTGTMDGLHVAILVARDKQMRARIAWARSPNADTIHAAQLADRELDVRLDQLLLRRA